MVEWFFNYSTCRQCIVSLSSLVLLFEGNLLEWEKLFSGEIYCEGAILQGANFFFGGRGVSFPRGQLSLIAIVRAAIFLRGNCPRTKFDEFYEISPNSCFLVYSSNFIKFCEWLLFKSCFLVYSSYFIKHSLTTVFKVNFELNGCFVIYAIRNSSKIHLFTIIL